MALAVFILFRALIAFIISSTGFNIAIFSLSILFIFKFNEKNNYKKCHNII